MDEEAIRSDIAKGGVRERRARDALVEENLALVRSVASSYARTTAVEYDDLVGAGNVGLVVAAQGWQPQEGKTFGCYASFFIRGEMNSLVREAPLIHIPERKAKLSAKVRALKATTNLSYDNIADSLGVPHEAVQGALDARWSTVSLSAPTTGRPEEGQLTLAEVLAEPMPCDTEGTVDIPAWFTEELTEDERTVVGAKVRGRSVLAIAKDTGWSRYKVSKLLDSAVSKLDAMTRKEIQSEL